MYEGERQSDIVAQLNSEGIKVSLKDFRQLLYRARKARKPIIESHENIMSVEAETNIESVPEIKKKSATKSASVVQHKPPGKMTLAEIDEMLKKPLDLDNI